MVDTFNDKGKIAEMLILDFWTLSRHASGTSPNRVFDRYVLKTLLTLNLKRDKTFKAILNGPSLTYGVGKHNVEVTIDADRDTMKTFGELNKRDEHGKMIDDTWLLIGTFLDGGTITFELKGVVGTVSFGGTGNDGRVEMTVGIDQTTDAPTFATADPA